MNASLHGVPLGLHSFALGTEESHRQMAAVYEALGFSTSLGSSKIGQDVCTTDLLGGDKLNSIVCFFLCS